MIPRVFFAALLALTPLTAAADSASVDIMKERLAHMGIFPEWQHLSEKDFRKKFRTLNSAGQYLLTSEDCWRSEDGKIVAVLCSIGG